MKNVEEILFWKFIHSLTEVLIDPFLNKNNDQCRDSCKIPWRHKGSPKRIAPNDTKINLILSTMFFYRDSNDIGFLTIGVEFLIVIQRLFTK